jgi:hypothetical protein
MRRVRAIARLAMSRSRAIAPSLGSEPRASIRCMSSSGSSVSPGCVTGG